MIGCVGSPLRLLKSEMVGVDVSHPLTVLTETAII